MTQVFSDGAGGVYLADGSLHHIDVLGQATLCVSGVQTTGGTVGGMTANLDAWGRFFSWSGTNDDIDSLNGPVGTASQWTPAALGGSPARVRDMVEIGYLPPYFHLTAETNGLADLTLDIHHVPAAADLVLVLLSTTPAPCGEGTGPAFGLWPDFFFLFFQTPPAPYSPFHYPRTASIYAQGELVLPPGSMMVFSGYVFQLTAVAYSAGGSGVWQTNVRTVAF